MTSAAPSRRVTFLFTDIEGSTRLWERDAAAMQIALEQHDRIVRAAIEDAGGQVFKTVGDAFCATFASTEMGLRATLAAQRGLEAADWSILGAAGPLRVRMALHRGSAVERDDDYFGPSVNRVARLEAAAHGGQVLLSRTAWQDLEGRLPDDVRMHDLGEHRLKDLRHSERIFRLEASGLPSVDSAPRTLDALHPRDRLRVADAGEGAGGPTREVARLWSAMLETIGGQGELTLSAVEAEALARHRPTDLRQYRLGRVAEWSQPRYRLDGRFVDLSLLVDQGEQATSGRWTAQASRHHDLRSLLEDSGASCLVVLGAPGAGKSTLLRRLELDLCIDALRPVAGSVETLDGMESTPSLSEDRAGDAGQADRIPFFAPLSHYAATRPGEPPPAPEHWLEDRWAQRYPDLPPLEALLARGRVTLLLDGLNEMPAQSEAELARLVQHWKAWLQRLEIEHPGNRVVFSCRSLDYSQPLSTPELRVPQVRVEPLGDRQVRDFLQLYSPARWRELWQSLEGSPHLDVLRSPYFLSLLVEQVEATGEIPRGRAALFTGFVRKALQREVERGNPDFAPGALLGSRDLRQLTGWRWKTPYDLPKRGLLVGQLAGLAFGLQARASTDRRSRLWVDYDDALDLLDEDHGEAVLRAGTALALLDEDPAADELMFVHQLVQEYFAARHLAARPEPERVAAEWRAARILPDVSTVIDGLDPADPLPRLPQTGWEETSLMAAAMAAEPADFVRSLADANLVLAARAAAQADIRPRLPEPLLASLRNALVLRSRSAEADLRERIACGDALGQLGDPRFERREGPDGPYLLPPMVAIPSGHYPIGSDDPIHWGELVVEDHQPAHRVQIAAFEIGQFAVTNAEWACFMAAGGYDDPRWWEGEAALAWQRGEGTSESMKANNRDWWRRFRVDPELLDRLAESGRLGDEDQVEQWRDWSGLESDAFELALSERWPARRLTTPRYWSEPDLAGALQPVIGISWYESRAYLRWLSAQSGHSFRLPSEVEWEAAARGMEGRLMAYGAPFDRLRSNSAETHLRRTAPVGVFPEGDTPEGVADLCGNTADWTSTAWGDANGEVFRYPYDAADGRERLDAPATWHRIQRGGSWNYDDIGTFAIYRVDALPGGWSQDAGLRVARG